MAASNLLEAVRASAGPHPHPHLRPLNGPKFAADIQAGLGRADPLIAYQSFLAEARSVKARRKSTFPAFERQVQAQARTALNDIEALCGSTLRVVGQANGTDLWPTAHQRMSAVLQAHGPLGLSELWRSLEPTLTDPQNRTALASAGLTDEIASALGKVMGSSTAKVSLTEGQISIGATAPGGRPVQMSLKPPGAPAAGILDLLGRAGFDRAAASFDDHAVYLEPTGSADGAVITSPDLFAVAAVASRRRVAEHVRKLEDTGLATYTGHDPATIVLGLLIGGLIASLLGAYILYLCDNPGDVQQPDAVCDVGFLLLYLGLIALGAGILSGTLVIGGATGLVLSAVGLVAYGPLYADMLGHLGHFSPQPAPS